MPNLALERFSKVFSLSCLLRSPLTASGFIGIANYACFTVLVSGNLAGALKERTFENRSSTNRELGGCNAFRPLMQVLFAPKNGNCSQTADVKDTQTPSKPNKNEIKNP